MAEEAFLSDEFFNQLTAVGEVDLLVGVPTANHAATIGSVLDILQLGVVKHFPRARCVVIDADAQSRDGTTEVVRNHVSLLSASSLRTMHRLTASYHPNFGRGGAWRIFLVAADLLRAKACVVVSPDWEGFGPEDLERLVRPVYQDGFDLVTPILPRPKFDGLLIKNLISPMVFGVYGRLLAEPVAAEAGLSGRLACQLLALQAWQEEAVLESPELWATTSAIVGGYRLAQCYLGAMRPAKRPSLDLVSSIRQAVGALFRFTEMHEPFWTASKQPESVPVFGAASAPASDQVRVQKQQMAEMFRKGIAELESIMSSILTPETFAELKALAASTADSLSYPDTLWVKTVYDFAASYHLSVINRDHLLQALAPLYRGRIGSFVAENHRAGPEELSRRIEELARRYQELLPYLADRWKAKN